jgi:hypothetical protein
MITQTTINTYKYNFACKLSCLAVKYSTLLEIGDACADAVLCDLITTRNLITILRITKGSDTETCMTELEICGLINTIKDILNRNNCDCGC